MSRKYLVLLTVIALLAAFATTAFAAGGRNFIAPLSGEAAGHPESPASGLAIFHLNRQGTALHYTLIVTNLDNVFQAHIHLGPPPGPVVVWLYPDAPPPVSIPGTFTGVLNEGVITEADLVGQLAGKTLEDLLALLRSGGTYVNVHTNDFVAPTNTGPGDFPGGEISGTVIQHDGHGAP